MVVVIVVVVLVVAAVAAVTVVVVIREPCSPSRYTDYALRFGCQALREVFLFFQTPRPPLKPTQPPIREAPWAFSSVVEQLGRKDDHLHAPRAQVKNEWICTSIPYHDFTVCIGETVPFTSDNRS